MGNVSKDELAYSVFDLNERVPDELVTELEAHPHIYVVRLL